MYSTVGVLVVHSHGKLVVHVVAFGDVLVRGICDWSTVVKHEMPWLCWVVEV